MKYVFRMDEIWAFMCVPFLGKLELLFWDLFTIKNVYMFSYLLFLNTVNIKRTFRKRNELGADPYDHLCLFVCQFPLSVFIG